MPGLWLFLVFASLTFIGLGIALVVIWMEFGVSGLLIGLPCYVLAWFAIELAAAVIFYTYGTFSVRIPRRDA
jgi:hypothetical protein